MTPWYSVCSLLCFARHGVPCTGPPCCWHTAPWLLTYVIAALPHAVGQVVSVYGMEVTLKVCNAFNEVQRINEELQLLPKEMQAHLQHWESVLDKQTHLISLLSPAAASTGAAAAESSTGAATSSSTADLAQRLQAGGMQVGISPSTLCSFGYALLYFRLGSQAAFGCAAPQPWLTACLIRLLSCVLLGVQACVTGRYLPDCTELAGDHRARQGAVSVLRRAQQEASRHLSTAVQLFQPFNISTAAAAERATEGVQQGINTGGQGVQDVHSADWSDQDGLSESDDEGCVPVGFMDSGSDSSEESEDCCDNTS